jgi:DNA polymerase-3 subunit alpha
MAGLIEEVRWRTPQTGKGNRYMLVTLSDRSGQYVASCFEEDTQTRLEAIAKDSPSVLVQAELMWRDGEDVPRVTMKGVTLLAEMARRARGRLVVTLTGVADVDQLAALVADARGKGRGELVAAVPTAAGLARLWLGRDYLLDAETMARVARAFGAERVMAEALDPPRLALVG